ncbi:MAG TPA: M28 family peptidase, partial [Gemmatimonadaceae bacterium]|nr:M28 family peptidase [Gemmatimonadaceae bacterium]
MKPTVSFLRLVMRHPLLALLTLPVALHAQNGASARASSTITEDDVRRRIHVIADDSMGGRDTPSRGLDLTARYVAAEFARFGLTPGGDSGRFEQRYPIAKTRLDGDASQAVFVSGAVRAVASARRDFIYVFGPRTGRPVTGPVVLVSGPLLVDSAQVLPIEGKTLVVVTDSRAPNATPVNQYLAPVFERGPAAVVIVLNNDTTTLARQVANQFRERPMIEGETAGDPVVTMVHERVLGDVFRAAGVDLGVLRASSRYEVRPLPSLEVRVTVANVGQGAITAPNVVGILEGSDPVLRNEYIVFSAHMDHVGVTPGARRD